MRLKDYLPVLDWLPKYNRQLFRGDLIAGITVAIMFVPQGMAYAFLAGMPPIYGLYAGLIPLILYAVLGTSPQLSIGPVAISSLLVLAGVSQLADPGSPKYIELVILAGLLIGIVQFIMGLLRMGFMVNFLSHPVIIGFTAAAAIVIAISQLKDVFGIITPRTSQPLDALIYAVQHIRETNVPTLLMSLGTIGIIVFFKYWKPKFPGALLVVILGTLFTWGFSLQNIGLAIVEYVPEGLPSFHMPEIKLSTIQSLLPVVMTVSVMSIVESISIAKVIEGKQQEYIVRPNQELIAIGMSKIGGAFFQSLVTSGSFTRSAINDDSGAKTGMSSIITSFMVGLTLLFFTPLFFYLPKAVLAGIILVAVRSLFDFEEAVNVWKTHRQDFAMMVATFLITLIFGIKEGVVAGVLLSLMAVLFRSSNPHIAVLGKLPGTTSYRNINRFQAADQSDKVLIVRFDNQLFFANASHFKDSIRRLVLEKGEQLEVFILDASGMHDIDSSGLHALKDTHHFLCSRGIDFYLSGAIGPLRDMLFKSGLMEEIGTENQFIKIHDAVTYHQSKDEAAKAGWSENAVQTNINLNENKHHGKKTKR